MADKHSANVQSLKGIRQYKGTVLSDNRRVALHQYRDLGEELDRSPMMPQPVTATPSEPNEPGSGENTDRCVVCGSPASNTIDADYHDVGDGFTGEVCVCMEHDPRYLNVPDDSEPPDQFGGIR